MAKKSKLAEALELIKLVGEMDEEDDFDDEESEYETEKDEGFYHYRRKPAGCRACGGDYPNCTSSCPMFDD